MPQKNSPPQCYGCGQPIRPGEKWHRMMPDTAGELGLPVHDACADEGRRITARAGSLHDEPSSDTADALAPDTPREYTVNELAAMFGKSPETIRLWIREGTLAAYPATEQGRRGPRKTARYRVADAEIERVQDQRRRP
jgi:hypothetical protein